MAGEAPSRRGLDPVPARIPRLPGAAAPREQHPPAPVATSGLPLDPAPPVPAARAAGTGGRSRSASSRPREFQLDKEPRDFIDSTVFAIRLRTESTFDRSALVRGIVKAIRRSGLDLAGRCNTEEEVTAYLLGVLGVGVG
jgi:hypothetical protein